MLILNYIPLKVYGQFTIINIKVRVLNKKNNIKYKQLHVNRLVQSYKKLFVT